MTSLAHAALDQLSALLGKRCLTDPDSAQRYGVDWTKVWAPAPSAVVLPETTEEVQQIVEIANEHGLHLVPSGGRTGLSAGAVETCRADPRMSVAIRGGKPAGQSVKRWAATACGDCPGIDQSTGNPVGG